jgi:hypothetical protein
MIQVGATEMEEEEEEEKEEEEEEEDFRTSFVLTAWSSEIITTSITIPEALNKIV